jgi:hypothetical protein
MLFGLFCLTAVQAEWDSDSAIALVSPTVSKTLNPSVLNIYRLEFSAGNDCPSDPTKIGSQFYSGRWDELFRNTDYPHAFGFVVQINVWNNEPIDYFYSGFKGSLGLEAMFKLDSGVYLTTDLSIGSHWDWGTGAAGYIYGQRYGSFQTNGFSRLGTNFEVYNRAYYLSIYANGEKTFSEARQSTLNGQSLTWQEDSAHDGSLIAGGMRFVFLRNLPVEPLVTCYRSYNFEDHGLSLSIGAGFQSWEERFAFKVCYKSRSNSIYSVNNYNGIESSVSLSFPGKKRQIK